MKNKLLTFPKGGVHPPKYKISTDCAIVDAPIPPQVYIPLQQHKGKAAIPVVEKGDKVKVGTLLAKADGDFSANIHSSVSGEVKSIDFVIGENGYPEKVVSIKTEGDEWLENIDRSPEIISEISKDKDDILEIIKQSGIVGLSGAGFPTPIKLNVPEGKKIDTLIINGIECEPYLTSDDRVMQEKAEEIVVGAKILNKVLGIQNALIAVDENKPKAIAALKKVTSRYVGVNVVVCRTKYPQGSEKQLIRAVAGREVPSGKLPADVGCIVQNVSTVFAIYEAVQKNKPLVERTLTLSGENIQNPAVVRVRLGTPASFVLNQMNIDVSAAGKVVFGGPMMGVSAVNIDAPITKMTGGILVFQDDMAYKPEETECIRCSRCVSACPMGLQPFLIANYVKDANFAELKKLQIMNCIECGSCAYICPAKIPLLDYCKLGKIEIRKQK